MPKTVLIVEDDYLNMMFFNDVLEANGYETLQAHDGGPVLDLVREHRPDLIVMDVQLPGVSGLEITRALKQDAEAHRIPVLALTAYSGTADEERVRAAGCDGFIAKPVCTAGFLEAVERHIG